MYALLAMYVSSLKRQCSSGRTNSDVSRSNACSSAEVHMYSKLSSSAALLLSRVALFAAAADVLSASSRRSRPRLYGDAIIASTLTVRASCMQGAYQRSVCDVFSSSTAGLLEGVASLAIAAADVSDSLSRRSQSRLYSISDADLATATEFVLHARAHAAHQ